MASFEIEGDMLTVPTTLQFVNKSENANNFEWKFGDGSTSYEDNPTHTFQNEGIYKIELIATNGVDTDQSIQQITISVKPLTSNDITSINNAFGIANNYTSPPEHGVYQIGSPFLSTVVDSDGNYYQETTTKYRIDQQYQKYKPIGNTSLKSSDEIYPGAIIQGKYWHESGELISYGDFKGRKPMTITVEGISNLGSKTTLPDKEFMKLALAEIFSENTGEMSSINSYEYSKIESHSFDQVAFGLGLQGSWIFGGFGANVDFENSVNKHTIAIYFNQKYFTVVTDQPTSPSGFFTGAYNLTEIEQTISSDNPAGYISSITYGRSLIATMTSAYSQEQMMAAIEGQFGSFSGELNGSYQDIWNNSSFTVSVSGGDNSNGLITDIEGVIDFINDGMSIQDISEAVPISYNVKYLDNTPFKIGDYTIYNEKTYESQNAPVQKFDVYIYGFDVIWDCDNGFLDNTGSGEFFYEIYINDEKVISRSELNGYSPYDASDSEWI